jgi:hypothetical protein
MWCSSQIRKARSAQSAAADGSWRQVLSERRCLMIEGRARLRGVGVLYRSALYPLSEDGVAIDHLLGAANYRPLLENEELMARLIQTKWL